MKSVSVNGFTLIELIVVIVLLGVMSAGAGLLITRPIEAYGDQLRRQQLVDSAEMAMRKIETDIRRALPNSLRRIDNSPTGWVLEMVNTVDGARYRDEAGGGFSSVNDILSFTTAGGDQQFNLLGNFTELSVAGSPYTDYRAVIYNTAPTDIYPDASLLTSSTGVISRAGFTLASVSPVGATDSTGDEHQLTLDNLFQFDFQSPTQRIFIVDGPVSYVCDSSTGLLTRFDGYAYQSAQSTIDTVAKLTALGANVDRVATQLSACNIDYQAGSPQRGALITLDLSLTDEAAESIGLLHQVHVDNVP